MPIVAKDGQPLLNKAVYGYDGTDWIPLATNSDGEMVSADCLVPTSLAEGQIKDVYGDIYIVPAATAIACIQILLYNSGAGDNTFYLMVTKSGGTGRELIKLKLGSTESYMFKIMALSAGDKIRGIAGSTNEINYVISGQVKL